MSMMFWDLLLLGIFVIAVSSFLYSRRKRIKKEGLLLLYHTTWGVKFIDKFGKKHKKLLKILSYISVFTGFVLMILIVYLFVKVLILYSDVKIAQAIRVPPITPLIPYLPQIFKIDYLPDLYFSVWLIALLIIAIPHEFFHGIFARLANVKTKTTGFGFFPFFFPVFLAAFVNLDEKTMEKRKNFEQMAVLSAGTFANVLTAGICLLLMIGIFFTSFSPSGVIYNDYAYNVVNLNEITSINGISVDNISYEKLNSLLKTNETNLILAKNQTYAGVKATSEETNQIALYYSAPAVKSNISGAITSINGEKIDSFEKLSSEINSYKAGETITLGIYDGKDTHNQDVVLENSPLGSPWLGIIIIKAEPSGIIQKASAFVTSYKNPNIYYAPNYDGAEFLYNLFWWLVLISFSVALMNMLPVGIFDGGRFFYLTILSITKSKKTAETAFRISTSAFLAVLVILMFFWVKAYF